MLLIFGGFHLLVQFFEPACNKAAGAAGEVRHFFSDFRFYHLRHKISYSTGRVKLTSRACALQFFQNSFVNLTKSVTFLIIGKVQLIDDIDHLTEQNTVLHILVCVGKGSLHNGFFHRCRGCDRQIF